MAKSATQYLFVNYCLLQYHDFTPKSSFHDFIPKSNFHNFTAKSNFHDFTAKSNFHDFAQTNQPAFYLLVK